MRLDGSLSLIVGAFKLYWQTPGFVDISLQFFELMSKNGILYQPPTVLANNATLMATEGLGRQMFYTYKFTPPPLIFWNIIHNLTKTENAAKIFLFLYPDALSETLEALIKQSKELEFFKPILFITSNMLIDGNHTD